MLWIRRDDEEPVFADFVGETGQTTNPVPDLELCPVHLGDASPATLEGLHVLGPPQAIEQYSIAGPYRAIIGVANTAGAALGNLGAGWAEPGAPMSFGRPQAVEPRVLLMEDLAEWPDADGIEALALRFGARLDLAFGGPGRRHLDHQGPNAGKYVPQ
jgi:hypothetical protein